LYLETFTSIDGEGDTQGWNRYSYVKGNPIVYKDPTGHTADWASGYGLMQAYQALSGGVNHSRRFCIFHCF